MVKTRQSPACHAPRNVKCESSTSGRRGGALALTAADLGRAATVAVGQVRGNVELPLVALDHQLHRLGPALDDLIGRKGGGRAAVVRRVELGARRVVAGRAALVVALAGRVHGRVVRTIAGRDDLVLQARRQRDDAVLLAVLLWQGSGEWWSSSARVSPMQGPHQRREMGGWRETCTHRGRPAQPRSSRTRRRSTTARAGGTAFWQEQGCCVWPTRQMRARIRSRGRQQMPVSAQDGQSVLGFE